MEWDGLDLVTALCEGNLDSWQQTWRPLGLDPLMALGESGPWQAGRRWHRTPVVGAVAGVVQDILV